MHLTLKPPQKNDLYLPDCFKFLFLFSYIYFQEQAIGALKLNGRTELVLDYLNKHALLNQAKSKETNGHVPKVSASCM